MSYPPPTTDPIPAAPVAVQVKSGTPGVLTVLAAGAVAIFVALIAFAPYLETGSQYIQVTDGLGAILSTIQVLMLCGCYVQLRRLVTGAR